ncbi:hypothetical protein [Nocardia sp. SC052]|uniref:hypothetical protein n=1 Tax=Nocardia sichangensis TaxID=3385975 RepID=UPI0039A3E23F
MPDPTAVAGEWLGNRCRRFPESDRDAVAAGDDVVDGESDDCAERLAVEQQGERDPRPEVDLVVDEDGRRIH